MTVIYDSFQDLTLCLGHLILVSGQGNVQNGPLPWLFYYLPEITWAGLRLLGPRFNSLHVDL